MTTIAAARVEQVDEQIDHAIDMFTVATIKLMRTSLLLGLQAM